MSFLKSSTDHHFDVKVASDRDTTRSNSPDHHGRLNPSPGFFSMQYLSQVFPINTPGTGSKYLKNEKIDGDIQDSKQARLVDDEKVEVTSVDDNHDSHSITGGDQDLIYSSTNGDSEKVSSTKTDPSLSKNSELVNEQNLHLDSDAPRTKRSIVFDLSEELFLEDHREEISDQMSNNEDSKEDPDQTSADDRSMLSYLSYFVPTISTEERLSARFQSIPLHDPVEKAVVKIQAFIRSFLSRRKTIRMLINRPHPVCITVEYGKDLPRNTDFLSSFPDTHVLVNAMKKTPQGSYKCCSVTETSIFPSSQHPTYNEPLRLSIVGDDGLIVLSVVSHHTISSDSCVGQVKNIIYFYIFILQYCKLMLLCLHLSLGRIGFIEN